MKTEQCNCMAHKERPHAKDEKCKQFFRFLDGHKSSLRVEVWDAKAQRSGRFDGYENYSPENFGGSRR